MIGLLTTKEIDFLTKLAELLKEYCAVISHGHCGEVHILAYHGDNEDAEKYPIIFEDSFMSPTLVRAKQRRGLPLHLN